VVQQAVAVVAVPYTTHLDTLQLEPFKFLLVQVAAVLVQADIQAKLIQSLLLQEAVVAQAFHMLMVVLVALAAAVLVTGVKGHQAAVVLLIFLATVVVMR
jgi:hypothetical protein